MQFYIVAPFLFILKKKIVRNSTTNGPFLSNSRCIFIDFDYMSTVNRLYQFLFGFFAFDCRNSHLAFRNQSLSKLFDFLLALGLAILLFVRIPVHRELSQVFVVILTFVIVARCDENWLLKWPLLVELGSVSYSVYLVHWPVFTFHRYFDLDMYKNQGEASVNGGANFQSISILLVGILLCSFSLFIGYFTTNAFDRFFNSNLRTWCRLLAVIFVGYAFNLLAIYTLNRKSVDLMTVSASRLVVNRSSWSELKVEEVIQTNLDLEQLARSFGFCEDESDRLPSNYQPNISYLQYM
ncbi:Acyltransferase [Aphelenchoides besseyi]|nr:Acyltransferase [Aphelenchoides besseyi]